MYSVALVSNIATFLTYWIFVHFQQMHKFVGNEHELLYMFETVLVHSLPMVVGVINASITSVVLSRKMAPAVLVLMLVVVFLNFFQVTFMRNGEPVFELLHWKHVDTPALAIGFALALTLGYLLLVRVDEYLKAELV